MPGFFGPLPQGNDAARGWSEDQLRIWHRGEGKAFDMPWGELESAEVTANQTGITTITDLTGLGVTVVVGANRRIKVTGFIHVSVDTVSDTTATLYVRDASGTLIVARNRPVGNSRQAGLMVQWIGTPDAGSWSPKLSLHREVGTGTLTMHASSTVPAFILVEDIGPA